MSSRGKAVASSPALAESSTAARPSSASNSTHVASSTIAKLAFFTVAMVTFPIGTYYLTIDRFFDGNATYAGISAAVMANVVLFFYVFVAVMEDSKAGVSPVNIKKQQ